jgi:hypothetical protein
MNALIAIGTGMKFPFISWLTFGIAVMLQNTIELNFSSLIRKMAESAATWQPLDGGLATVPFRGGGKDAVIWLLMELIDNAKAAFDVSSLANNDMTCLRPEGFLT